jgi:hypothetical protein
MKKQKSGLQKSQQNFNGGTSRSSRNRARCAPVFPAYGSGKTLLPIGFCDKPARGLGAIFTQGAAAAFGLPLKL